MYSVGLVIYIMHPINAWNVDHIKLAKKSVTFISRPNALDYTKLGR